MTARPLKNEISPSPSRLWLNGTSLRLVAALAGAAELAGFALGCESAGEILARRQAIAQRAAPSLFETKK